MDHLGIADLLENHVMQDLVGASFLLTTALATTDGLAHEPRRHLQAAELALRRATLVCSTVLARLRPAGP